MEMEMERKGKETRGFETHAEVLEVKEVELVDAAAQDEIEFGVVKTGRFNKLVHVLCGLAPDLVSPLFALDLLLGTGRLLLGDDAVELPYVGLCCVGVEGVEVLDKVRETFVSLFDESLELFGAHFPVLEHRCHVFESGVVHQRRRRRRR